MSDGACTASVTKHVTDMPTCIENVFEGENKPRRHPIRGVENILLSSKGSEVLGRPGDEEAKEHV